MKKLILLVFALLASINFVACSSSDDKTETPPSLSVVDLQGDWRYDPDNGNIYTCSFSGNHIEYLCININTLKGLIDIEGNFEIKGNTLEVTISNNVSFYGATKYKIGDKHNVSATWLDTGKTKLRIDNFTMTRK